MPGPKKQLSLDANFVFDLAAEKDFAHDFLEAFQRKGYALVLPPTASHELQGRCWHCFGRFDAMEHPAL
jgi:hypothetical protein